MIVCMTSQSGLVSLLWDLFYRTWIGWILTFNLNCVASYINPLLFLFEQNLHLTPLISTDDGQRHYPAIDGSVSCHVQSLLGHIGEGPEWWWDFFWLPGSLGSAKLESTTARDQDLRNLNQPQPATKIEQHFACLKRKKQKSHPTQRGREPRSFAGKHC